MNETGTLRIAAVNLLDGGIDPDGSTLRRDQSVAALRPWRPHLVLVQELFAPGEELVRKHFRALANALDMEPGSLGIPRGSKRLRCGILADTSLLKILDEGPPPVHDAPFWAEAIVQVRATGTQMYLASVHAPATTATGQRTEAERLGTRIAQRGMLAVAGGDWNCYSRDDGLAGDDLAGLSPHLGPSRLRRASDGRLVPDYDVHDVLTLAGLADPLPAIAPGHRDIPGRVGTGSHPRARIDRFYATSEVLPAVRSYSQRANPGADHHIILISVDVAALAAATPPGPRP